MAAQSGAAFCFAIEIATSDFTLTTGHCLTAISLFASTLNSAAAFTIAVASSRASRVPSQTALVPPA